MGGHYTNAKTQTQTVDLFRLIIVLKSVHLHFAPGKIALELLGQFLRFLDQNDGHSRGVAFF